jgi:methionine synthase reductase
MKKVCLKDVAKCMVIICSTTGNGDAPENADGWWRANKLRSAEKDRYADVPYAVLGLGDTNYDKFCHMGKSIDKRLTELGGKRLMAMDCADEATGLEEPVENWKAKIFDVLQNLDNICGESQATEAEISIETKTQGEEDEVKNGAQQKTQSNVLSGIPAALLSFNDVASRNKMADMTSQPVEAAQMLVARRCDKFAPFTVAQVISDSKDEKVVRNELEWSSTNPFTTTVKSARWLTINDEDTESTAKGAPWGESKRVIEMEMNLCGSGIQYEPGDSIGICVPNPPYAVSIVLQRLRESHPEMNLQLSTVVSQLDIANSIFGGKQAITIQELLMYRLDIMSIPKKAVVAGLAKFCIDETDTRALQWICSKGPQGKSLYTKFIEQQKLGTAELLYMFPSCKPPLQMLCAHLPSVPPRYYSIACSPLTHPSSAVVAFSVVRYSCIVPESEDKPSVSIKRSGICTTYLEKMLSPWLQASTASPSSSGVITSPIRIFHKPTLTFHLPGSIAHPLIMVGPGTGVAPFIGFLEHRAQNKKEPCSEAKDVSCGFWRGFELEEKDVTDCAEANAVGEYMRCMQPGKVHLYFGCRNEKDYLYREALERFALEGTISNLQVAMSRVETQKVYVQDRLRECGADVVRLLVDEGAFFYICGDGNKMAKDVIAAVTELLIEHRNMEDEEADLFIQDLKQRRRFILDIWS